MRQPFPEVGTCTGCGAEIRWARTIAGKRIPLDPEPVEGGRLVPTYGALGQILVRVAGKPHRGPRWRSHFDTCPNRAAFRAKPRRPR